MNLLIKKVKRVGHGFRNFANYRLRLLLHCGVRWQTHRTARLRSRLHVSWRDPPYDEQAVLLGRDCELPSAVRSRRPSNVMPGGDGVLV